jgi:hypothetical protein
MEEGTVFCFNAYFYSVNVGCGCEYVRLVFVVECELV